MALPWMSLPDTREDADNRGFLELWPPGSPEILITEGRTTERMLRAVLLSQHVLLSCFERGDPCLSYASWKEIYDTPFPLLQGLVETCRLRLLIAPYPPRSFFTVPAHTEVKLLQLCEFLAYSTGRLEICLGIFFIGDAHMAPAAQSSRKRSRAGEVLSRHPIPSSSACVPSSPSPPPIIVALRRAPPLTPPPPPQVSLSSSSSSPLPSSGATAPSPASAFSPGHSNPALAAVRSISSFCAPAYSHCWVTWQVPAPLPFPPDPLLSSLCTSESGFRVSLWGPSSPPSLPPDEPRTSERAQRLVLQTLQLLSTCLNPALSSAPSDPERYAAEVPYADLALRIGIASTELYFTRLPSRRRVVEFSPGVLVLRQALNFLLEFRAITAPCYERLRGLLVHALAYSASHQVLLS